MAKGTNQKFKLYRLAEIMLEHTDEDHYIMMPEIIEKLAAYDITADRKSIYQDLRNLEMLGIEIEGEPVGNRYHYHVVSRDFELPELKLLVDAIQSSKFITEKKSNTLIKKLERLVSKYDAQKLQRQVYVSGRIKTMNESIYYAVDTIHNAISENKKIQFQYFQWNVKKEMELRHGGAWYHISPWGLSWDDENYYLVGYDADAEQIKHYRVDKMLHISMSEESREGKEHFKKLDMADYAKKSFGMFGGEEQSVKLLVHNSLAGVIIDRFGKDVMMIPVDKEYFSVNVAVHVSRQFLGWVFSLGEMAKIVGPETVVNQMHKEIMRLREQYKLNLPNGNKKTIEYYNENAKQFVETTANVEFHHMQNRFLEKLQAGAYILDFGCGSGRDTKYFLEQGYQVEAIDGSEELCKLASELTGREVKHMYFQELSEVEKYDGIWACSSILHLNYDDLKDVMKKMTLAVKKHGIIYSSFKYGTFSGERNGRYFTDMTEETFERLLQKIPGLEIEEQWITSDVRPGRGEEKWLNLILRKN